MTIKQTTRKYDAEMRAIKTDARALKYNVNKLVNRITEEASKGFDDKKQETKENIRSAGSRLKQSGTQRFDMLNKSAAAHPVITLVATAAAGVLATRLLRR